MYLLLLTLNIFEPFYRVYIADFEQENFSWAEKANIIFKTTNWATHVNVFNNYILQITPILYFLQINDKISTPQPQYKKQQG